MFKDKIYRETFDKWGFCIIPIAQLEKIDILKALYQSTITDDSVKGLYASHNANPYEKNLRISEEINSALTDELAQNFADFSYYIGHFMVKEAKNQSEFALHQDWNIVDEQKHKSYQIWIPLQTTDQYNGGMFLLPGSHKLYNNYRSGSFDIPRIPTTDAIKPLVRKITVPVGSALIYSNATFHGSFPNTSENNRISVIINIFEKDVQPCYFHHNKAENSLEKYSLNSKQLLTHLPRLEKGIVPDELSLYEKVELSNHIDNSTLNAEDLVKDYAECKSCKAFLEETKLTPIFKSAVVERQLNTNGYLQIPFLDENEIEAVRDYFERNCNSNPELPRYTTLEFENFKKKNEISEFLTGFLKKKLDQIFENYKIPLVQFFVKNPNTDGEIDFHTDTTLLLNPHLEPHYAIWIPLLDVDENNGTLALVPKSHLWYEGVVTNSIQWPFMDLREFILKKSVNLKIRAGELIIFDNRMIHSSTFNSSNKQRVCVAGRVTHQFSNYYSFFKESNSENRIGIYAEKDDYYLSEKWKGDQAVSETGVYLGDITQVPLESKTILHHG